MTKSSINYKEDPHGYTLELLESYNKENMTDIGDRIATMIARELSPKYTKPKNNEEALRIIKESTREELIRALYEVGESYAQLFNDLNTVLNDMGTVMSDLKKGMSKLKSKK